MRCECPNCGTVFYTGDATPLKKTRLDLKLTIPAAAERLGISQHTLIRLEKGGDPPPLELARRISRVYVKPIDELWPEEPEAPLGESPF